MRAYLLRLICAAFLCALIDAIGDGPGQKARQMAMGTFLTLTALSFPNHLELPDFHFERILQDAETVVSAGQSQSQDAQTDIIMDACTAYILTEANALGLTVEIEVKLNDDLMPKEITLTGIAPITARETLCNAVAGGLGLKEEDVIWIDLHQSSA